MSKTPSQQIKKETALKNFRYNRFLLLRYILAGFFFANVYWTLALLLSKSLLAALPAGLLIFSLPAISEHLKLYGDKSDSMHRKLRNHLFYQHLQIAVNIMAIIMTLSLNYQVLYPFITKTPKSQLFVLLLHFAGLLLSVVTICRIKSIYGNMDKHYGYIKEFAKLNE